MDDLLIRGAPLYDGSGADPVQGDLAVRSGRIRAIGAALPVAAKRVVDAQGLALMPGIIDSHTHFAASTTRPLPLVRASSNAQTTPKARPGAPPASPSTVGGTMGARLDAPTATKGL